MVDLETIKRSKHFRKKWTQLLRELDEPPQKVEAREGQGLNLLVYSGKERFIHVCISPAKDPRGFSTKTAVASLRHVGDFAFSPVERQWFDRLSHHLKRCDDEEGWAEYLDWTMEKPGISVGGRSQMRRVTSGHEVVIRLLEHCNAACDFCGCIGTELDYATRQEEVKQRLIDGNREGATRVVFTGGEPTLVPHLPELVSMAKANGFQWVNLQTNGVRLADADLTRQLAKAGLDSILLSLHSHDPAVHDQILKLEGAFEDALKGIENCLQSGIQVALNYVINRDNIHTLADYMDFVGDHFRQIGVPMEARPISVTMSFVSPVGWALENLDQIPRMTDCAPEMAAALDKADAHGLDIHIPGLCGVPICMLPGYEEFFDEYHDENPPRLATRAYVDACEKCEFRSRCSGYWKVYLEQFGGDELGQKRELPQWSREKTPDPSPELIAQVEEILKELDRSPNKSHTLPYHELACLLNERKITTPRGGRWTDAKVLAFSIETGLLIPLEEATGWVVDGFAEEGRATFWLRGIDGGLTQLAGWFEPEIHVGATRETLEELLVTMQNHPRVEAAALVQREILGQDVPADVLQITPRDQTAYIGLVRKIRKRGDDVVIYNEGFRLIEQYLYGHWKFDPSQQATFKHDEEGTLYRVDLTDLGKGNPLPVSRVLEMRAQWKGDALVDIGRADESASSSMDGDAQILEEFLRLMEEENPDVVVCDDAHRVITWLMELAESLKCSDTPGRGPAARRAFHSEEYWMRGRVVVDARDWNGPDEWARRIRKLGVLPRCVQEGDEESRLLRSEGAIGLRVGALVARDFTADD